MASFHRFNKAFQINHQWDWSHQATSLVTIKKLYSFYIFYCEGVGMINSGGSAVLVYVCLDTCCSHKFQELSPSLRASCIPTHTSWVLPSDPPLLLSLQGDLQGLPLRKIKVTICSHQADHPLCVPWNQVSYYLTFISWCILNFMCGAVQEIAPSDSFFFLWLKRSDR